MIRGTSPPPATAAVKISETRNGFELAVQTPINVRAVLVRDPDGVWSLDTIDAIDGCFLSERQVIDEIADQSLDPEERALREEAHAQRWAIDALRRALTVPFVERVA